MWLVAVASLAAAVARWNDLPDVPAIVFVACAVVFTGAWLMQYKLRAVRFLRIMRGKPDRGPRNRTS